jgi:hypothetical protein
MCKKIILLFAVLYLGAGIALKAEDDSVRNPNFGVCTHFAQKRPGLSHWVPEVLMPQIGQAGFGWIRDEILWREVETEKGVYQIPEKTRRWIDAAAKENLKVVVCFNNGNSLYDDPFDPDAFADAAAFVAQELKGEIAAIEILNEPFNYRYAKLNGGGNWNGLLEDGSVSPWVAKYVELLNKSAEAIAAVDPEIPVIGLGSNAPVNFRQLSMGLSPAVTGITAHPYSHRSVPEIIPYANTEKYLERDGIVTADEQGTFVSQMDLFRETSLENGGPEDIWLTEWGYTTYREGNPERSKLYSGFTEVAKAKYTLRRFMECLAIGVDKSFVYSFMDDGDNPFEPEDHFGLIDFKGNPKPVLAPVTRLMKVSADLVPDESLVATASAYSDRATLSADGDLRTTGVIRCYGFRDASDKPVIAIWSTERDGDLQVRSADVELPFDASITTVDVYDMMTGHMETLSGVHNENGLLFKKMPVPDYPILIYPSDPS